MTPFELTGITADQHPTTMWATLGTWSRLRGRLTSADLVALLFDEAAAVEGGR